MSEAKTGGALALPTNAFPGATPTLTQHDRTRAVVTSLGLDYETGLREVILHKSGH